MADSRIDDLRRRLERDPGSRLFAQLAEEFRKAGNHADAIRVARTGLAQHPSYPSARLTLGRALLDSGDLAGARVELETVLREAPDNILASRFLGQALEALGELGPALVQLQRTLKMAPGDRQLESQIASLETRLRAPQASGGAPSGPPASPALVPTLRLRPPDVGRWAPAPPPLPTTAAPAAAAPAGPPPLPPPVAPRPVTERPQSLAVEYESDMAPTLPTAQSPLLGLVDETAPPTPPPSAVATEETVFEPEPTLVPRAAPPAFAAEPRPVPMRPTEPGRPAPLQAQAPPGATPAGEALSASETPFSSSTLAELYLKQGLVDRALEVYRQLLAEEPGNDRARSRLAEIERMPLPGAGRAARRQALERTISGLEALLAVVRRR